MAVAGTQESDCKKRHQEGQSMATKTSIHKDENGDDYKSRMMAKVESTTTTRTVTTKSDDDVDDGRQMMELMH